MGYHPWVNGQAVGFDGHLSGGKCLQGINCLQAFEHGKIAL